MSLFTIKAYDAPEGYGMGYFNIGRQDYLMSTIDFDGGGELTVNIYKNEISFYAQGMEFNSEATMNIGDVELSTKKDEYGEVVFRVNSPSTITKIAHAASSGSVNITLSNGKKAVWSGPAVKNLQRAINLVKNSSSGLEM